MRFLQYSKSGQLSIHSFADGDVPPYAILSHTWAADGEEVTFADLQTGQERTKPGYEKILFCAKQAHIDGLQHFWIDTCCIDTSDKAEHSHAIRSMFRWYSFAARCYVYLSDVSLSADSMSVDSNWELAFRSSRWFTRGWTLQELLAPSAVEFFSKEGEKLGDTASLAPLIHKITNIPPLVLNGAPISQFSIDDRWRWAEGRTTKRSEDRAYSLQGVFGVELAPLYGEGESGAFDRLKQEIYRLQRCLEDMRSTDPRDDKKRIEDTKGGLIKASYRWVVENTVFMQWHENQNNRLLWVKGDPGKGKTMLLCGIIDELQKPRSQPILLSYFFCQATDSRINSATAVLRGLLYMLIVQQPLLAAHVRKKHDHAGGSLFSDANAWTALKEILSDIINDASLSMTYLIIDALDECTVDQPKLLKFIVDQSSPSSRVKWIVSSRNWPIIEERLQRAEYKTRLSLELNAESVAAAVKTFIQQKVSQLAEAKRYTPDIQDRVLQHLTLNSNDTFLWVALVCQDLEATPKWSVLKKLEHFPPGLDSLYRQMLLHVGQSDGAEICLGLLAVMSILYRPVTVAELVALAEQIADFDDDLDSVREIIGFCGSFLTLRDDTIYFVHQSAKDFLVEKASDKVFPDGPQRLHREIFLKSLPLLHKVLHRDMYKLEAPGYCIEDIISPLPNPLALSRYPCDYWIDHLCDSRQDTSAYHANNVEDARHVDTFIKRKYVYWLEALSLGKSMAKGMVSMTKLWHLVQKIDSAGTVITGVRDARRFILYHKEAIERYPLQAYISALLFSPADSVTRIHFQHELLERMTMNPSIEKNWSACLQTFMDEGSWIKSVAFSHDSSRLATGSSEGNVKIWDVNSGTCLHTFEDPQSAIRRVTFSPNSRLVSMSSGGAVKIWDVSSGTCLQTFMVDLDTAFAEALSHDFTRIVSQEFNKTMGVWDISSGTCLRVLDGYTCRLSRAEFSHDSTQIASGGWGVPVRIWDSNTGVCLRTLKDDDESFSSIAFSHNSTHIATGSDRGALKMWDANSGTYLQKLGPTGDIVTAIAFSHDSNRLVSGTAAGAVNIYNTKSGIYFQKFEGHTGGILSVVFSHDSTLLASGSEDGTVRIWDTNSRDILQAPRGHHGHTVSSTFSHDLSLLVFASSDGSISVADANTGVYIHTFGRDELSISDRSYDAVRLVAFSPNLARLVSASYWGSITVWDLRTKKCLQRFESMRDDMEPVVAFSADSSSLAFASRYYNTSDDDTQTHIENIEIWDISNRRHLQTIISGDGSIGPLAFSHDLVWLASASHSSIAIWDISSGLRLKVFEGLRVLSHSIAFSPDAAWLVASIDNAIRMWNTSSWECQHILDVGTYFSTLAFDPTSTLLHTRLGNIFIPDVLVESTAGTARSKAQFRGLGITEDGAWITRDGNKIVWVPYEYRSNRLTVNGSRIGIGNRYGKACIFHVDG